MRLSHHALELEAQPPNELDGCPVIFWEHARHSPQLRSQGEVPHRRQQHGLTPPQPPIEQHDVHVGIQPRTNLRRSREANRFLALHDLVELVRRS
jgi:hypothetical protein